MPADRNQNRRKLQELLRELFQFDTADLDFGIYKILHHRKEEIERFIEADLLDAVNAALQTYQAGELAGLEEQLAQKAQDVRNALGATAIDNTGVLNPQFLNVPMVQGYLELQEKLASTEVAAETEAAIYNDLYTFFSRYYDNGDFLSKRRYSSRDPKYFIPYNGEEVMLHWANRDQYYVKSGEHFIDYRFRLEGANQGQQVHFQLDRADVPQDNVKASTDREFVLRSENPVLWDGGTNELTVLFEYRPLTDAETADYLDRYNSPLPKSKQRKTLDRSARCVAMEQVILTALADNLPLRDALAVPHKGKTETSLLNYHLNQYTARNTSDYFVHKDLGGFLTGQLDFYLKNEVLDIDALIGNGNVETMQHALRRAQVVRAIAEKVIAFLAQIENFQKRLFEKKKFVVRTDYCVTLDRVPEELYPAILDNPAQLAAWKDLYAIDRWPKDLFWQSNFDLTFLNAHPYLMVDTRNFDSDFVDRLLANFDNLDETTDGLLIHGENFQAITILLDYFRKKIRTVYIDPPYNTNASAILYKNDYKHSAWLTLMENRLNATKSLLSENGVLCIAIDDFEYHRLHALIESIFGGEDSIRGTIVARSNPSGRSTLGGISPAHEYALVVANSTASNTGRLPRTEKQVSRYGEKDAKGVYEWVNFRKHGGLNANRVARPRLFYPIYAGWDGNVRIPEIEWNAQEQAWQATEPPLANEEIVLPLNAKGEEKTWKWGHETANADMGAFQAKADQQGELGIYMKSRMRHEGTLPLTWWGNKEYSATDYGTNLLANLFGESNRFTFPKALHLVEDCLRVANLEDGQYCLDFFGGSGTTSHAVINLNREDDGERKYILVEVNDYFDTVIIPRIHRVTFATKWKDGVPQNKEGISHLVKILRLESYEDALNNVRLERPATGQDALLPDETPGYLLSYMLDVESRNSPTLLTQDAFATPFDYKLLIQRGYVSPQEQTVDLVETFHYLIGLHVKTLRAYEHQERRYRISTGEVHAENRTERIAVVWRNTADLNLDAEKAWIAEILDPADFDIIYVNGTSHIPKAEPLELTFRTRMETPPHAS